MVVLLVSVMSEELLMVTPHVMKLLAYATARTMSEVALYSYLQQTVISILLSILSSHNIYLWIMIV